MTTKLTVVALPRELAYDNEEIIEGGAQYCHLSSLSALKKYWTHNRANMRFACVGTGYLTPARFLSNHEWVFSPTKEALVSAVVRWNDFRVGARWFDRMSDEWQTRQAFQRTREERRKLRKALGTWSNRDEVAYVANSQIGGRGVRTGFWRLVNLPCGLNHFAWFSEFAKMPDDPNSPRDQVIMALQLATFDDWKIHQTLPDVHFMNAQEVDSEIDYWETEGANGRESYED